VFHPWPEFWIRDFGFRIYEEEAMPILVLTEDDVRQILTMDMATEKPVSCWR